MVYWRSKNEIKKKQTWMWLLTADERNFWLKKTEENVDIVTQKPEVRWIRSHA